MQAMLDTGLKDKSFMEFKGVTKIILEDGFLKVFRDESTMGTYSLDCFKKGSEIRYFFTEEK